MNRKLSCRFDDKGMVKLPFPIILSATILVMLFAFFTKQYVLASEPTDGIWEPELVDPVKEPEAVSPESIKLNTYNILFETKEPYFLSATVEPSEAQFNITWISNDENVAKVNEGIVIPVGDGVCDIIATVFTPSGFPIMASCQVEVQGVGFGTDSYISPINESVRADSLSEFLDSDFEVDRYQYETLEFMKFASYFMCLVLGFLVIIVIRKR